MKAPKTRSAPLPTLGAVHLSFASICTGIHISLQTYSLTDPLVVRGNTLDPEKHNLNIHCTTAPAQTSTHLVSNTVVETVSIHQCSSTPNLQPKNTIATEPQIAKESHV